MSGMIDTGIPFCELKFIGFYIWGICCCIFVNMEPLESDVPDLELIRAMGLSRLAYFF